MSRSICLGTDFDNTVVCYDHLFRVSIEEMGIDVPVDIVQKPDLRSLLRAQPNGEILWQKAQADVYGRRIEDALMIDGFRDVVAECRRREVPVFIVSHKTRYAEQDRNLDLREAALRWMGKQGFFDDGDLGFKEEDVFFEATRRDKVLRIGDLGCTHFVDDMLEVLMDPDFPKAVEGIWHSAGQTEETVFEKHVRSWLEVSDHLFM